MSERGNGSEVNWAGNIIYGASRLLQPQRIEEVQQIVREGGKLKVLGARHSFSDVADFRGTLLSLDRMPQEVTVDAGRRRATVSAWRCATGSSAAPWTPRGWRCTTPPHCPTSPSPAPARRRRTAQETATATWPQPSPGSSSCSPTAPW